MHRAIPSLVFAVGLTLVPPAHAVGPTSDTSRSVAGMVRSVDATTRDIAVITGVGYATRLVRLRVADDCRIVVARAASDLSHLTPGAYVRVQYVTAPVTALVPANLAVEIEAFDARREEP